LIDSLIPLIILSLSIAVAIWFIFMWAVKSGQFDDIEGPKHRMMEDDDEEPRPEPEDKKDESDKEGGDKGDEEEKD